MKDGCTEAVMLMNVQFEKRFLSNGILTWIAMTAIGACQRNATVRASNGSIACGTVVGVVRDHEGKAIESALVSVLGTAVGASTDASGRFTLVSLPAGEHTIVVRRIGYQHETTRIRAMPAVAQRVEIVIVPEAQNFQVGPRDPRVRASTRLVKACRVAE